MNANLQGHWYQQCELLNQRSVDKMSLKCFYYGAAIGPRRKVNYFTPNQHGTELI